MDLWRSNMTSNLNPEIIVDTTSFPITVQMLKQSSTAPASILPPLPHWNNLPVSVGSHVQNHLGRREPKPSHLAPALAQNSSGMRIYRFAGATYTDTDTVHSHKNNEFLWTSTFCLRQLFLLWILANFVLKHTLAVKVVPTPISFLFPKQIFTKSPHNYLIKNIE